MTSENIEQIEKLYKLLGVDGKIYLSPIPGILGGNSKLKIYGRLDCWSANAAIPKGYATRRVFFADEKTAIKAGYRPCGHCMKDRYKVWKVGGNPGSPEYPWLMTPKIPNS